MTHSGSVREYSAIWSPQGDQVAYITDSLDGQSLVVSDQIGTGDNRTYKLGAYFRERVGGSNGDSARDESTETPLSV